MFRCINDKYWIFASNFIKVHLPVHNIQPWYVNVDLTFLVMVCMSAFSVVGGKLSGVFQPLLKQIEFDNNLMQSFSKTWDYTRRDNLMRFILLHIKNFAGRQSRYIYNKHAWHTGFSWPLQTQNQIKKRASEKESLFLLQQW